MKKTHVMLLIFCFAFGLLCPAWIVLAQADQTIIQVTLLDQSEQPLADTEITLILIRYGELAVETTAYANCHTDQIGQCTFDVSNPPRLASGHAEAYLDVTGIGRRWVSWQGDRLEVTLTVAELILQATVGVPNELGYEYETPGAYNSPVDTAIPATITPSPPMDSTPKAIHRNTPESLRPSEGNGPKIGILPLVCGGAILLVFGVYAWRTLKPRRVGPNT